MPVVETPTTSRPGDTEATEQPLAEADTNSSPNLSSSNKKKPRRRRNKKQAEKESIVAESAPAADQESGPSKKNRRPRHKKSGEAAVEVMANEADKPAKKKKPHRRRRGPKAKSEEEPHEEDQQATKPPRRRRKDHARPDYPPHLSLQACLEAYARRDMVRGRLKVLAGAASAFVTCDRGDVDVCIPTEVERNRAMDGDTVFVVLDEAAAVGPTTEDEAVEPLPTWQQDDSQMNLWNPLVSIPRKTTRDPKKADRSQLQRKGKVVHIVRPKAVSSELGDEEQVPTRRLVGSLKRLPSGRVLLIPNNKSLPHFLCPAKTKGVVDKDSDDYIEGYDRMHFQAEYEYGAWSANDKWPPCRNVKALGKAYVIENEVKALLAEFDVDHGEFSADVLKEVDKAVESGVFVDPITKEMGWKPTEAMLEGRRDFRSKRIFTIDPTTAKDLDDALHIEELPDGRVEIGVHIADVSHFVHPSTVVDVEAQRRATTVYLVDRTIPMLPRPLCEIACSLNENVERLAFSCVWRMNKDGTMRTKSGKVEDGDIWYGRSIIKSCARLDYATAQNIIDKKVANGESDADLDEDLWPSSRRPTGGHSIADVALDVRLMHTVAMARRKLRFDHGALALHGIKLTFKLGTDGQTPLLAAPYPIRDSNRLVEEYMLLANYLVAQRLISHAGGRAVLRHHPDPLSDGLDKVAEVAKAAIGFDIDITSSASLHASLVNLARECTDELVLSSVTQMLMTPMQPADYFAAGSMEPEAWKHFALNIPYYTHFTSPIRRYADVMVHRLLQATLDGEESVNNYPQSEKAIQTSCDHCNEKRMASKNAQEKCDRVFLALSVRRKQLTGLHGIVLSVGNKTFTVFVPSLGVSGLLFLDEHQASLTYESIEHDDGDRTITLTQGPSANGNRWDTMEIKVFAQIKLTMRCREHPPVDIKFQLEGPWNEGA